MATSGILRVVFEKVRYPSTATTVGGAGRIFYKLKELTAEDIVRKSSYVTTGVPNA